MSGGRWCLGLARWAVKITHYHFHYPGWLFRGGGVGGGGGGGEGGFGDGGTRGTILLRCPRLQTSNSFHYRKVMAQGARDLISQTILDLPLLCHFHGALDFYTSRHVIETAPSGRHHIARRTPTLNAHSREAKILWTPEHYTHMCSWNLSLQTISINLLLNSIHTSGFRFQTGFKKICFHSAAGTLVRSKKLGVGQQRLAQSHCSSPSWEDVGWDWWKPFLWTWLSALGTLPCWNSPTASTALLIQSKTDILCKTSPLFCSRIWIFLIVS